MDDYCKELELQAFDKCLNKNHFLKRTLQLVVSAVSIFSLLLCYSLGFSFSPHSFSVYFSTFFFSFFTHILERKYMFLICNGILAFLAKSSVRSSSTSSSASAFVAGGDELSVSELPEMKVSVNINESPEDVALVAEEEQEEKELAEEEEAIQEKQKDQVEHRKSTEVSMPENEDEESVIAQEEAEAEAVAVNEPSTDELNKKIEEFIRKMKEEIRIEAQQQLIAV